MSEIPGEISPDSYEGLTAKEIEILEAWKKKAASQPKNFAALNRKGRKAWGIKPKEELAEKQARDERDAPSK